MDRCARQWKLTIRGTVGGLSFNYVAGATTDGGEEVILNLGNPHENLSAEARALKAFAGKKVPQLLQSDGSLRALVLRKISPGTPLAKVQEQDEDRATTIVAELIRDLPVAVPANGTWGTYVSWTEVFDRLTDFPEPSMLAKAKSLVRELEATKPEYRLLHGDLHHHNILLDGRNDWIAIDPKGVAGDPAAEAGRMLHNPTAGFLKTDHPKARAANRVKILANITRIDADRFKKWGYVDSVLSAAWNVDRDYRIECAKLFEAIGA